MTYLKSFSNDAKMKMIGARYANEMKMNDGMATPSSSSSLHYLTVPSHYTLNIRHNCMTFNNHHLHTSLTHSFTPYVVDLSLKIYYYTYLFVYMACILCLCVCVCDCTEDCQAQDLLSFSSYFMYIINVYLTVSCMYSPFEMDHEATVVTTRANRVQTHTLTLNIINRSCSVFVSHLIIPGSGEKNLYIIQINTRPHTLYIV